MIKFVGGSNEPGKEKVQLIGLGISRENVKRLENDKPIFIKGSEIGFPDLEILIFFKETDAELAAILEPMVNDNTILSTFTEYRG